MLCTVGSRMLIQPDANYRCMYAPYIANNMLTNAHCTRVVAAGDLFNASAVAVPADSPAHPLGLEGQH